MELSNLEAIKQVDVSNTYINIPLGTIPVYKDGDGTHVGSLPDLAPDSNDLEEVGDVKELQDTSLSAARNRGSHCFK